MCQTRPIFQQHHPPRPAQALRQVRSLNLLAEARTQQYLYKLTGVNPKDLRIPAVIDVFTDNGWAFLVMEYIEAPTLEHWIAAAGTQVERKQRMQWAAQQVAATVAWLHTCPRPVGTYLGPIGGGLIQHDFFADREAPLEFADVQMLQDYINRVRSSLSSDLPGRS